MNRAEKHDEFLSEKIIAGVYCHVIVTDGKIDRAIVERGNKKGIKIIAV